MGASGWEYVVAYQADLGAALAALRLQVFEQGDYLKPSFYGANGGGLGVPDPTSLDDLHQEPYWEFMGTSGTHSIIDVFAAVPQDPTLKSSGRSGRCRKANTLSCSASPGQAAASTRLWLARTGSTTSSPGGAGLVARRCCGATAEIVFWGYSGD